MVTKATISKKGNNKRETKGLEQDYSDTYSKYKEFEDRRYAEIKKGRKRKWNYDPADWIERSVAQEDWGMQLKK